MASFQETLKAAKASNVASAVTTASVMTLEVPVEESYDGLAYDGVMTLAAEETFQKSDKYLWYNNYYDDNYSTIDSQKNVKISDNQINLTQEANSQVIPFLLDRYYDGIDLMDMTFQIFFVNSDGNSGVPVPPINVEYSDTKIRFYWLVGKDATMVSGALKLEIQAIGSNEKGDEYVWKTKTNNEINILESLAGNGVIEPGEGWNTYIEIINQKVLQAQTAADEAKQAATEASQAASELDAKIESASDDITAQVEQNIAENYYTKTETDTLIENIDISDQLTGVEDRVTAIEEELETFQSDPSAEWVTAYDTKMDNKISTAVSEVQADLDSYKEQTDADLQSVHTAIDDLPSTLESDYYTKEQTDELLKDAGSSAEITALSERVTVVESSTSTNKENISTLGTKVGELETTISGIDQSPRLTYDVKYNDTEDTDVGENVFAFYEITNEGKENEVREIKQKFTIVGGGGGSATSSSLKIGYVTTTPLVVTADDSAIITFTFSGTDSSGDAVLEGAATWKVANRVVATSTVVSGENSFDITNYITLGTQKVTLSVTDDAGSLVTKSWTVQKIDVHIESTFNDQLTYPIGTVSFDYTPYGAISKVIHFVLDGNEIGTVTTSASGIPMAYTLPEQTHGAHLLDVYMTAVVNNNTIESNHITKDIIWYDSSSTTPVISCVQQDFTMKQYDTVNISYTVYDPTTETPTITIADNGKVLATRTLSDSNTDVYPYKATDVFAEEETSADHTITITCGEIVKTLKLTVEKLDINVTPVTAGLAFDFNPIGRSNNDSDRLWSDDDVAMTVSDNFDWVNGGYQIDANGDQYFCIKAGTSAEINYQLFADDAKKNGKEFKFVFKTANVQEADAQFMSCVDNTTGTDHIGIEMFAHEAYIYGSADKLNLKYSENDIIEFEFNITKNTETVTEICGYEDGCSTRHLVYDDSFNFTQNTPKTISLGSDKCDLHIYRIKAYSTSLTARGVLNNFIADARNAEEMVDRYNKNQIYDENQELTPETLAEACPWLRVYVISAPYFTNKKSDKVPYTTIRQIYKNGDPILDNWICYDCSHSGQGTSSDNYGAAARNLDFIMNKSQREGINPYFILGDGITEAEEISLTRTSIPVAYLNFKANVASSNHFTNALLAKKYNEFNPYKLPYVREDESIIDYIKTTMEFHNAVVFIQETNEDISTHREFADCQVHFYSIGNIGDSKKTDATRLVDPDDKYECIVEIMDVDLQLSEWPVDTMINAMGYTTDEDTNEIIYTWATDNNLGILYEKIDGEYVLTTDTSVDLTKTYYVDILEHDDFSEDYTYGWRYVWEDGTDEENALVAKQSKDAWINLYRFVTTATDAEFKAHFSEYFVLDSALYYYLFTERYCMTDNRCKNSFWHFGKTGTYRALSKPVKELLHVYCELVNGAYVATTDTEIDESKTYYTQYAFDLAFGYDMDTAMSLNNYGNSIYRHGYEDSDVLDGTTEEVFRESKSTFFCRLRDNFVAERKALFNTLESQNAWHAESFLNEIETWQDQFAEELWRLDCQKKYVDSYTESFIGKAGDPQFLKNMAQGKMKYAVKQWERSQEAYMASKYQSSTAASDNAVLRCTAPDGELVVPKNYKLKLTPYDYIYLNVKYGTQSPIQLRAKPGIQYEIPFTGDSTDIIDIYSASRIQDLGDLSTTYPATVDTAKATRLKELHIGNATEGYDNPYLTTMTLGANYLLEILNVENVSGLTQSLNLTALNNLRELYAHGTNTGGVTFADGGSIEIAELPAINALSMKNLLYLTTLDVTDFSKLTTLTVENCNTVDLLGIFDSAPNINRVRITGIDWTLEDTTLLERIYEMSGIDKNGYNTEQSVLAGKVHVPVIRQQALYEYQAAWPDLEIVFDTMIVQYAVNFVNYDGTILETQYVDKGADAVDPITREEDPMDTPTKPSTISHDFTFAGWDSALTEVFGDRTITATYTESLRTYTVKYVSKGITMQETSALYGENVVYTGEMPVYTSEEAAYVYQIFNRWDKSGIVDGDKTINAIFDRCEYVEGYFDDKELADLTPVEIYAMTKLGLESSVITDKDSFSFSLGNDVSYDDIDSELLIAEKSAFTGSNYLDTGLKLFEEDKDFVLAVDYEFLTGCETSSVLMQCFQANGSNGFKLWYNSGVKFTWGTSTNDTTSINNREMIIIRHKKGDNNITIYNSNISSLATDPTTIELTRTKETVGEGTLVFGAARADDGIYENYAVGNIYWAKIWYMDLGDDLCNKLALWTHELFTGEACGFRKYYLSENASKRCAFSLLGSHLLSKKMQLSNTQTNTGGWGAYTLNKFLNKRLYNAIPDQIRSLIKQVRIPSSIGNKSIEVETSDCYIAIPALIEVDPTMTTEPYMYEGTAISYMSSNDARKRAFDGGDYAAYWLRSPNASYTNYVYQVDENGQPYGYNYPTASAGVVIEISI